MTIAAEADEGAPSLEHRGAAGRARAAEGVEQEPVRGGDEPHEPAHQRKRLDRVQAAGAHALTTGSVQGSILRGKTCDWVKGQLR